MSNGEILSSTGDVGRSIRPEQRLYENADLYELAVDGLFERFVDLCDDPLGKDHAVSRYVLRGVISDDTMAAVQSNEHGLRDRLEVAVPLAEFGQPGWLVYLAENSDHRQPLVPLQSMVVATQLYRPGASSITKRIEAVHHRGYTLCAAPQAEDSTALSGIWGRIFGWEDDQIAAFIDTMDVEQHRPRNQRETFFVGLRAGQLLVGAAMGETLRLPTPHGDLALVESTEWGLTGEYRQKGLMPVMAAALNAQIAASFNQHSERPFVYAEFNYVSRSDQAGYAAGFRSPPCQAAPQINLQNVTVNDEIREKGLRDFVFRYVPAGAFREEGEYSPAQVDRIMSYVDSQGDRS